MEETTHGESFSGTSYRLRLATPADAELIARVGATFFADTFGVANRPEDLETYLADAFSETRQRVELSDPCTRIWLALDGEGQIAGYVQIRLAAPPPAGLNDATERPAEIARLYADRRWHGQGLGQALMRAAVDTARDWGADLLWLGVWERNARAIAFYEKQGFGVVGEQDFLLGSDRQRDHVMARRLTSDR